MKQDLGKRLEALEKQLTPEEMTILHRFVKPGPNGPIECDPVAIKSGDWRIDRAQGEPLDAFRERARLLAPANKNGVRCLMDVLPE